MKKKNSMSSADGAATRRGPTRSGQSPDGPLGTAGPTSKPELPEHLSTSVDPKKCSAGTPNPAERDGDACAPLIQFRTYQREPFLNRTNGIEVWCWSRQIGKSFTLAAWAVDRLLTRPGRLVTYLSNSLANGQEFMLRVAEVCVKLGQAYEQLDLSAEANFESMKLETHIVVNGMKGRIRVLAASPRTARGFSGDLILDEFAWHENSVAIWEAAEPIISSNPDFLCRIASTPNGKHNMFYRLCSDPNVVLRRVPRSLAHEQGLKIYHPLTRKPISPAEARKLAQDKKAYDQNYECIFADEASALLTYELIARAETPEVGVVCWQDWNAAALAMMQRAIGNLWVGVDVGRNRDLTCIAVWEEVDRLFKLRGLLTMEQMRGPAQLERFGPVLAMPKFRKCKIDMTGLGVFLMEFGQDKYGASKIEGVHFSSTVPVTNRLVLEGRKKETAPVTEVMATEMLGQFEDNVVRIMPDAALRESLRKPERIVTPSGRVSIAATRDEAGHADEFWALALGLYAARGGSSQFVYKPIGQPGPDGARRGGMGRMVEKGGGALC